MSVIAPQYCRICAKTVSLSPKIIENSILEANDALLNNALKNRRLIKPVGNFT